MTSPPILVAYDGRCPSTLDAAATLARALGLGVVLATAYRYDAALSISQPFPSPANERRFGRADAIAEHASSMLGDLDVQTVTLPAQDVREALLDLAQEIDATAIVVGPDLHGDVSRTLIAHASCPVLVAPEDPRLVPPGYRQIGVAYDGSVGSRFALTAAVDLAIRAGAHVHIVSVATDEHHAEDTELTAERAAVAIDRVSTSVEVRHGDVARQLRRASETLDLMVCGSHGRGRVFRALLGSVSSELMELPNCPVLVVPPHVRRRGGTALGLGTAAAS